MSMAHKVKGDITDCDGSDSFKYTVFKDANCFIKGSLADLFKADFGPGYTPSQTVIESGAVMKMTAGGSIDLGKVIGPTSNSSLHWVLTAHEVVGCNSPPPPPPANHGGGFRCVHDRCVRAATVGLLTNASCQAICSPTVVPPEPEPESSNPS